MHGVSEVECIFQSHVTAQSCRAYEQSWPGKQLIYYTAKVVFVFTGERRDVIAIQLVLYFESTVHSAEINDNIIIPFWSLHST